MQNPKTGPRRENFNRPGNSAALEAVHSALTTQPVEGKQLVRLRKRQIEPDLHQPRRRKRKEAIQDKRESLEQEGQQQPVKVIPLDTRNRQGEPMYRLIDGELRWHGTPTPEDYLETIIETRPLTPKDIFTQQVISNTSEDFTPAECCSIAWVLNRQYKESYREIATGVLRKYRRRP